tara:strand:- start:4553 stop:5179 length:627 start_codon:yes stop_codon:yes gene_type:complete
MLYVQQSLGPDEEILMAARFHWMYTLKAVLWIVFGLSIAIALAYGAIWWDLNSSIRANFPNLPAELYPQAEAEVLQKKGGYLKILWSLHPAYRIGILASFVMGLFMFANMMIIKATTEIAVTTDRLIYKRGLIARSVGELSIDRVEGVSVLQGILGRVLGYGKVSIRGMGVGEVVLPPIEDPIEFRKAVQEARMISEKGGNTSGQEVF